MTATGHPLGTPEDVIARLVHARITACRAALTNPDPETETETVEASR